MRRKETKIRIDATNDAFLLNRYVAYIISRRFNTKGSLKKNVCIEEKRYYKVQWQNVRSDIRSLFRNPLQISPKIAWSLAAFLFIFLGKHEQAYQTAFVIGAISHDASAETSTDGEPATVSYTHTVGAGSDKIILIGAGGLNTPNAPTFGGNATTAIDQQSPLRAAYYLNPSTGTVSLGGGNIKNLGSISLFGVHQTTPIGATAKESDSSLPNGMDLTTGANNSLRVDTMQANNNSSTNPTATLDVGTRRLGNDIVAQNQFRCMLVAYTTPQATAGAATHTWSGSNANETRKYISYEVKEAAAAVSDIKKLAGINQANLKKVAGIAIASVKKVAGVSNV